MRNSIIAVNNCGGGGRGSVALELDAIDLDNILRDARGLETRAQNVGVGRHVVRHADAVNVGEETE